MQFQPPISDGDKAQYYYISNNIVQAANGAPQPQFLRDDMVNFPDSEGSHDSNYPVHVRNYLSFMNFLKWTIIMIAIITATVLYVISN